MSQLTSTPAQDTIISESNQGDDLAPVSSDHGSWIDESNQRIKSLEQEAFESPSFHEKLDQTKSNDEHGSRFYKELG